MASTGRFVEHGDGVQFVPQIRSGHIGVSLGLDLDGATPMGLSYGKG